VGYGEKDLSSFKVSISGLAYWLIDYMRLSLEFFPTFTIRRSGE
jgi:hypothetical protein